MSSRSWKLIWVASCWLLWPGQSPAAQIIGPRVSRESSFVPNRGQDSNEVLYCSRNRGHVIALTRQGAMIRFENKVVRMMFHGANPNPQVKALDLQSGRTNYLIGSNPANWHTDVPNYGRVQYSNMYPGVDLFYHGDNQELEYDLMVAPGGDPNRITLAFDGADRIRLQPSGDLEIGVGGSRLMLRRPHSYQEIAGVRREVGSSFALQGSVVAFRLGRYDRNYSLVIDPVLAYSTFLGGSSDEVAFGVATDSAGNSYVAGYTASTDFPATTGAYKTAYQGGEDDVFVAKYNSTGALVYATYVGGSGDDIAYGLAVDSSGNAYLTGSTASADFPTSQGAYQTAFKGGATDAFLVELNSAGNGLVYATYLGGSGNDVGYGIALDAYDEVTVTGSTTSNDFPVSAGAFHTSNGGGLSDAFVARLNASGTALLYSTYLGGSGEDVGLAVAVDSLGNAYVTGYTQSTNFPVTLGVEQTVNAGDYDAYVAVLNPSGTALVYSTYLGGNQQDYGVGIAVDTSENAYVTGYTTSSDYPHTAGALQTTKGSGYDAFITKLTSLGVISYSTFLGGSGDDFGLAIAVDSAGDAYITGDSASTDFPTTSDALATTTAGYFNAFVTKLSPNGTASYYSTYVGGSGYDTGYGIAVDSSGAAYVAGYTVSSDFPITAGAAQSTLAGGSDAFVLKFPNPPLFSVTKTHTGSFTQGQTGAAYTVTVSDAVGAGPTSGTVTLTETVPPGLTLVSMTGTGWACPQGGTTCTRNNVLNGGSSYPAVTVTVNVAASAASPATNQVSVSGGGSVSANASDATTILLAVTPAIAISSLSPASAAPGGGAFTLTVNGTSFVSGATVNWNGTTLATTFVSATQLTASVPATLIASAGMATVTVVNPGAVTSGGVGFTIQSGPAATAVSPGAGNGASQTFTFTFSDPSGYQNLQVVDVLINNYLDGIQACYVAYSKNYGMLLLVDDGGDSGTDYAGYLTVPSTGSITGSMSNSQCTVNGTGSSVVGSGNTLTLTLNISFSPSFAGNRIVYTAAGDTTGNSGWQALSTWQVPGTTATPTQPTGVTPASGSGASQSFVFTFTDTAGWQDLGLVDVLFNNYLDGIQACYVAYSKYYGMLLLVDDGGDSAGPYAGYLTVPSTGSITGSMSNSQCTVNGTGSSAAGSGNTLTLTLNVSFTPAFAGNRIFYTAAGNAAGTENSGWQALGAWTVP